MIAKHKRPRLRHTLLGVTLLATLALAGLTTAKPTTNPAMEPAVEKAEKSVVVNVVADNAVSDVTPPKQVTIRVRVTYPDGSPGKNLFLLASRQIKSSRVMGTEQTDHDGYYSVKVPEGGYFAVIVNGLQGRENDAKRVLGFASPVVSVYVGKNSPEVIERDIVLEKGIPLRGRLIYENGKPAVGKSVHVNDYPFGRELINVPTGGGDSNEQGEYVVLLTPGEYVVSQWNLFGENCNHAVTIRPDDTECVLDLILPAETTGTILLPDGTPAVKAGIWQDSMVGKNAFSSNGTCYADSNGNFRLPMTPFGNMLLFYTEDKSLGLAKIIDGDERLEHHTLTLQPPEIGRLRFVSQATGKPIAGIKIRYATVMVRENVGTSGMPLFAVTDNEGYAELKHLFIGATYKLDFHFEPQRLSYPAITRTLTPTQPGQTVDYGEITIHGDFSEYEPKE